jgi:hypothetical protein
VPSARDVGGAVVPLHDKPIHLMGCDNAVWIVRISCRSAAGYSVLLKPKA